jgi:type VI secretion system protein VasG
VTIPYYPLDKERLSRIVRLQLDRVARRVEGSHRVPFTYDDAVVDLILGRCAEVESGGRVIDNILTNTVLPTVSRAILERMLEGQGLQSVGLRVDGGDFAYDIQ